MNYAWYTNKTEDRNPDIIHQIFAFGSLEDILSLKKRLGKEALQKVFLEHPKKIYTPSLLYFIKNFILDITIPIDEQHYLKHTSRNTR